MSRQQKPPSGPRRIAVAAAVRSLAYRDAKVLTLLETAAEVMGLSAEAPALRLADDLGREHRHLTVGGTPVSAAGARSGTGPLHQQQRRVIAQATCLVLQHG
jgi:hypothetical protein